MNRITEINKALRNAGISDKAFKPRNAPYGVIAINPNADENRPGAICQAMRNIGYVLYGDWGWQLSFRKA